MSRQIPREQNVYLFSCGAQYASRVEYDSKIDIRTTSVNSVFLFLPSKSAPDRGPRDSQQFARTIREIFRKEVGAMYVVFYCIIRTTWSCILPATLLCMIRYMDYVSLCEMFILRSWKGSIDEQCFTVLLNLLPISLTVIYSFGVYV